MEPSKQSTRHSFSRTLPRLPAPTRRRQVQEIVDNYHAQHGAYRWTGDSIATADVNEPGVLDFLSAHRPDVIFSMCTLNYFRSAIRSIPRLGIFLWHEGITPQYKGTYPAFWAIHNRDFDKLGYTLLKMNHVIDGGDVFVQGPARDVDYQRHGHNYIGHKAVFDSLPDVGQFLLSLEDGTAAPLDRAMSDPATTLPRVIRLRAPAVAGEVGTEQLTSRKQGSRPSHSSSPRIVTFSARLSLRPSQALVRAVTQRDSEAKARNPPPMISDGMPRQSSSIQHALA